MGELIGGIGVAVASILGGLGSLRLGSRRRLEESIEVTTRVWLGLPEHMQKGEAGGALETRIIVLSKRLRDRSLDDFTRPAFGVTLAVATIIMASIVLSSVNDIDGAQRPLLIALGMNTATQFGLIAWSLFNSALDRNRS